MAGLAFINPHWGYMSQGAFCLLPMRPYWYRLALAWIPRYIIAIIILGLAVAIYTHVGFESHLLSSVPQSTKQSFSTTNAMLSAADQEGAMGATACVDEQRRHSFRRASSILSVAGTSRRASAVTSLGSLSEDADDAHRSHSIRSMVQSARRRSSAPLRLILTPTQPKPGQAESEHPSYDTSDGNASPLSGCPTTQVNHQLPPQRARIHRQLRLMFIYPIVYILMWLMPFVNHCMLYHDGWASHPLYWLSLLGTICITLMGAVDCLIFSLRERPWEHIPSSDGTFLGSFICWRTLSPSANSMVPGKPHRPSEMLQRVSTEANPETPYAEHEGGWISSVARVGRSVRTSGSSDQALGQAELARTRLEMEKEDRRAAGLGDVRRTSRILDVIESPGDEVLEVDFGADSEEGSESGMTEQRRKRSSSI
jgi:hypothetical protein